MHDSEFEKQVQQKMQELRFAPGADVWMKVQADIRQKKRRRPVLLWVVLAGLLIGSSWFLYTGVISKNETAQIDPAGAARSANAKNETSETNKTANAGNTLKTDNTDNTNKPDDSHKPDNTNKTDDSDKPDNTVTRNSNVSEPDNLSKSANSDKSDNSTKTNDPTQRTKTIKTIDKKRQDRTDYTDNTNNRNNSNIDPLVKQPAIKNSTKDPVTNDLAIKDVATKDQATKIPDTKITESKITELKTPETKVSESKTSDTKITETKIPETKISESIPDTKIPSTTDSTNIIATEKPSALQSQPPAITNANDSAIAMKNTAEKKSPGKTGWELGFNAGAGISDLGNQIFQSTSVADFAYGGVGPSPNTPNTIRRPPVVEAGGAFQAGGYISKNLGKKFRLKLGLNYEYFSNSIRVGSHVESTRVINQGSSLNVVPEYYNSGNTNKFTNRYHFISLPLSLQLKLNNHKKWGLIWENAISPAHLINSNALHYDGISGAYYKDDRLFKKTQWMVGSSLLFNMKTKNNLQLYAGPHVQYGISNLMTHELQNNKHLRYAGLKLMVGYNKK